MYIVLEHYVQAMHALLCINESCSSKKIWMQKQQPPTQAVENGLMCRFASKIQLTRSLIILY